jgi:hypothetical protein
MRTPAGKVDVGVTTYAGIDEARSGLPCRASVHCSAVFRVPSRATLADLQAVARERDAHELAQHAYAHMRTPDGMWSFSQRFSKRGRSTMGEGA